MTVKTIRFNKHEENIIKALLNYYHADFSTCVKALLAEKLEDLQDIGFIAHFKEGKVEDYLDSKEIEKIYSKIHPRAA